MRLFFAVFPPPDVQAVAAATAAVLRAHAGDARVAWAPASNLHVTLRFLGPSTPEQYAAASAAGQAAAPTVRAFSALLGGSGAFPTATRAKILWLGIGEGAAPLRTLAEALDAALAERGFARADLPFAPHLTLGRVRGAAGDWTAALAALAVPAAQFEVRELLLVESRLRPGGAEYVARERFALGR